MRNDCKEVYWGRKYPKRIEDKGLVLTKIAWGRRLLYDVQVEKDQEYLGSCHILEMGDENGKCCTQKRFKVEVWSTPSSEAGQRLKKRREDIRSIFCSII